MARKTRVLAACAAWLSLAGLLLGGCSGEGNGAPRPDADESQAGQGGSSVFAVDSGVPPIATADAATASDAGSQLEPPSSTGGCGLSDFPVAGAQTLEVAGMQREFIVALPDGYASSVPHRLIFAWHGQRGTAQQVAALGYYGLESRAGGTAIFVTAQGLDTSTGIGGTGWDNMNGRDIAFTRAMLDYVRERYCIDDARIFSVGMSYGGIMSNNVGCALGDVFRAIAPMAGLGPINAGPCVGQVAVWKAYGNADTLVPASYIDQSHAHWVAANHCAETTQPAGDNGCVAHDGCDEGHPVIWCLFDGAHVVPPFAGEEIWAFFSQF
jgi:poly(3-hydroxybutyrate) depolymerase